ncbi:MAG: ArnT family glycosyltransferase [Candidatus Micrarchaeia archaeon]
MSIDFKSAKKFVGRDKEKGIYLILAIIVAYDLFRAATHILGPTYLSEDFAYVLSAFSVLRGYINIGFSIDSTRILQYLPIALFYRLFGINIYTSSAWNVIAYIGTVIITFFVGKEVYNSKAGLVAALLISFFTPVVKNSVTVGINEAMMFFVSLAMLAVLYGHDKRSAYWIFAAGFLAVMAQLTIPIALIALLGTVIYVLVEYLRKNISIRIVSWFFAGIIVAALIVALFSYANTGDPLVIIHQNSVYYSNLSMTSTTYGIIGNVPSHFQNQSGNNLIAYLMFYPNAMFNFYILHAIRNAIFTKNLNPVSIWNNAYKINTNNDGLYFYAVLLASLILLILEDKKVYFPLLWLGVGLGFLDFAPMSISLFPFRYILSFRALRYTTAVAVPIAVILSIAIVRIMQGDQSPKQNGHRHRKEEEYKKVIRGIAAVAIIVFLVATSIPLNEMWYQFVKFQIYPLQVISNYLNTRSNISGIFVESNSYLFMTVYLNRNNSDILYQYSPSYNCTDMEPGSYIIIPNITSLGLTSSTVFMENATKVCPNLKLVMTVNATRSQTSLLYGISPLSYQEKLYYYS